MAEEVIRGLPDSCILFATADWDEPYWTNKQHCAKTLANLGVKVLYVESVGLRSPKAESKRDWHRLRDRLIKGLESLLLGAPERSPGIYVLSPLLVPAGYRYPLLKALNRLLLRFYIARSLMGKVFRDPIVWTYHPFILDVLRGKLSGPLLYHCVDDLAAVPGVDALAFRQAEDRLLRRADVVFATAPALAEHCQRINPNTHFLPNVVDIEHFAGAFAAELLPEDLVAIPEPRLCYHGVLSDFKIDFELLLEAAKLTPTWHWIFIGEEREGQDSTLVAELARLPNVHFLGYRPYAQLPEYLRGVQVGLLPSLLNDYTRSMFPMKYFEYLAAGIPVVSTSLEFTKYANKAITVADNPEDFVNAIKAQLVNGRLSREEAEGFVKENTWEKRLFMMLNILNKTMHL